MFQSYQYIKYLSYDQETDKYSYQYKLVDSEFEEIGVEVVGAVVAALAVGVGVGVAVAQIYQQRGYSDKHIAKQLFLCFRYFADEYGYSLDQLIVWHKKYTPELWEKYGEGIRMFLLFS